MKTLYEICEKISYGDYIDYHLNVLNQKKKVYEELFLNGSENERNATKSLQKKIKEKSFQKQRNLFLFLSERDIVVELGTLIGEEVFFKNNFLKIKGEEMGQLEKIQNVDKDVLEKYTSIIAFGRVKAWFENDTLKDIYGSSLKSGSSCKLMFAEELK